MRRSRPGTFYPSLSHRALLTFRAGWHETAVQIQLEDLAIGDPATRTDLADRLDHTPNDSHRVAIGGEIVTLHLFDGLAAAVGRGGGRNAHALMQREM